MREKDLAEAAHHISLARLSLIAAIDKYGDIVEDLPEPAQDLVWSIISELETADAEIYSTMNKTIHLESRSKQ